MHLRNLRSYGRRRGSTNTLNAASFQELLDYRRRNYGDTVVENNPLCSISHEPARICAPRDPTSQTNASRLPSPPASRAASHTQALHVDMANPYYRSLDMAAAQQPLLLGRHSSVFDDTVSRGWPSPLWGVFGYGAPSRIRWIKVMTVIAIIAALYFAYNTVRLVSESWRWFRTPLPELWQKTERWFRGVLRGIRCGREHRLSDCVAS